ncbi:polyketide synthase [Actinophytocola gossypii]|uniref:Enoyl-CoA hydratase/isomerase family protein n=1 Tax=Actinophytocola gossypii TaxID=2812003 RepID=A0ABT2J5Q0_9PSEU|nr:polyketide synthase [Actinophytocola gossypii]MCT2583113.1 enoyl-CoA hydratase/isomerase family protein [Actinophytocola gossypii]
MTTATRAFGPVRLLRTGRVALVTMADEASGNTISPALSAGLEDVLAVVATDPTVHAVVVTGLPDRFSCGASREYLAAADPVDVEPFVRAFVHCPLPVVAAMRGHAVGGGLSQGLYADIPILSERSMYAANFLNFGLAPAYGTTWLLPARLGSTLGTELLLTARAYRGAELRDRGAPVRIVPHDDVVAVALAEAERIARAPRRALELMKAQLAGQVLAAGDAAIEVETGPHERSWAAADRLALVGDRYGRAEELRP